MRINNKSTTQLNWLSINKKPELFVWLTRRDGNATNLEELRTVSIKSWTETEVKLFQRAAFRSPFCIHSLVFTNILEFLCSAWFIRFKHIRTPTRIEDCWNQMTSTTNSSWTFFSNWWRRAHSCTWVTEFANRIDRIRMSR